ncbi:DsbA family protein [Thermovibrio sp.]
MKNLITIFLLSFLVSSCSMASQDVKPQKDLQKEEFLVKALLSPLSSRGVVVKEVKPVPSIKVPGFNTLEVELLDKRNGREIKKYIFVSPDGKYLALEVFKVNEEGKKIKITPITPKNSVKKVKVDLSWVKKVDKELQKENIPHVVGKSDKKVYVIWDVYCPFCYSHFNQVEEVAKKNKVEIHLIPFPIHGDNSLKGLLYYTQLAREKGAAGALKELYNLGNGDFMTYVKRLEKKQKEVKLSEKEKEELTNFFKKLKRELIENGVHATPTMIYIPPGEKDKGYITVGFKPISQIIKEK